VASSQRRIRPGIVAQAPAPYMGSVEVAEACEAYVWKHASVCELSEIYPQITQNAANCAELSRSLRGPHGDLLTQKAEHRLANALLRLGHDAGRLLSGAVHVDVTNEQLGNLSDVGMFTATRVLKKWERQGAIAKKRN